MCFTPAVSLKWNLQLHVYIQTACVLDIWHPPPPPQKKKKKTKKKKKKKKNTKNKQVDVQRNTNKFQQNTNKFHA